MDQSDVIDKGSEALGHYGVLGMHWGVRRDQRTLDRAAGRSEKTERKAAAKSQKKLAKADKKWEKSASKTSNYFKVYNAMASEMNNGGIDKYNSAFKQKHANDKKPIDYSDHSDPRIKEYFDGYAKLMTEPLNRHTSSILSSTNPSGSYKIRWDANTDGFPKMFIEPNANTKVKHADESDIPSVEIKLTFTNDGRIKSISIPTTTMSHDEMLEHYGILGMKWGVRRDQKTLDRLAKRRSSKSSKEVSPDAKKARDAAGKAKSKGLDSLSNDELQSLVNRMNLEQNFNNLSSKANKGIMQKGGKVAGDILMNVAKQQATRVLNNYASNALDNAIKKKK